MHVKELQVVQIKRPRTIVKDLEDMQTFVARGPMIKILFIYVFFYRKKKVAITLLKRLVDMLTESWASDGHAGGGRHGRRWTTRPARV